MSAAHTVIYQAVRYAADGHAGEQGDGEIICEGSLAECREAIRRAIGPYFDDPDCPWTPHGDGDVEAYNESADEGCGGFVIRIVRESGAK
jgi:hypothetical protein